MRRILSLIVLLAFAFTGVSCSTVSKERGKRRMKKLESLEKGAWGEMDIMAIPVPADGNV